MIRLAISVTVCCYCSVGTSAFAAALIGNTGGMRKSHRPDVTTRRNGNEMLPKRGVPSFHIGRGQSSPLFSSATKPPLPSSDPLPSSYEEKSPVTHGTFSPSTLETIKSSISLTSVIESHNLPNFSRTSPTTAKASCPFHDDRTPSLTVNDSLGIFKCFGCGMGGDVFRFLREYRGLNGGLKMSFPQAIRATVDEYLDGGAGLDLGELWGGGTEGMSEEKLEERRLLRERKARILLANSLAAEHYGNNLRTLPGAGRARIHLMERNISPGTVRAFALGYAPDVYFGSDKGTTKSLVEHLKSLEFTPQEIFESGLAVVRKDYNMEQGKAVEDYDCLMDRFRNRLMFPIMNMEGGPESVLGFGGRILSQDDDNSSYKPAKYLNSPETLVFKKKDILFGSLRHLPSKQEQKDQDASVILVEGYFDALSLYEAGIHSVVASMGTSITKPQLEQAAKLATSRVTSNSNKSILYIALDNDTAGQTATERLCTSDLLTSLPVNDIRVVTLPDNIKDPSEFISEATDGKKSKITPKELFQTTILQDGSHPWYQWYISRLVSLFDKSAPARTNGSFADIAHRTCDFLSVLTKDNPAERTRMAHELSGTLADLLVTDSDVDTDQDAKNRKEILRIPLERDLLEMARDIGSKREALRKRVERVQEGQATVQNEGMIMSKLSKGEGTDRDDTDLKGRQARYNATQLSSRDGMDGDAANSYSPTMKKQQQQRTLTEETKNKKKKPWKPSDNDNLPSPRALTPHFSGFQFANEEDKEWLLGNLDAGDYRNTDWWKKKRSKTNLILSRDIATPQTVASIAQDDDDDGDTPQYKPRIKYNEDPVVYFNSNQYHGMTNQEQAADLLASSSSSSNNHGENGQEDLTLSDVHDLDPDLLLRQSEERLLQTLIEFPPARNSMKAAVLARPSNSDDRENNDASFVTEKEPKFIEWSHSHREWLFDSLMNNVEVTTALSRLDTDGTLELRRDLAQTANVPTGAFGNFTWEDLADRDVPPPPQRLFGTLDFFFLKEITAEDDISRDVDFKLSSLQQEQMAQHTVQETLSVILQSMSMKKMKEVKRQWRVANTVLSERLKESNGGLDYPPDSDEVGYGETSDSADSEMKDHVAATATIEVSDVSDDDIAVNGDTLNPGISKVVFGRFSLTSTLNIKKMDKSSGSQEDILTTSQEDILTSSQSNDSSQTVTPLKNEKPQSEEEMSYHSMSIPTLQSHCLTLLQLLSQTSKTLQDLTLATKRIYSKNLVESDNILNDDLSMTNAREFSMSDARSDALCKTVQDFVDSLPDAPKTSGADGNYVFGADDWDGRIDETCGGGDQNNVGGFNGMFDKEVNASSEWMVEPQDNLQGANMNEDKEVNASSEWMVEPQDDLRGANMNEDKKVDVSSEWMVEPQGDLRGANMNDVNVSSEWMVEPQGDLRRANMNEDKKVNALSEWMVEPQR